MGRCHLCKKKCGLLSIDCKGCNNGFCFVHRLPEDHQCECLSHIKDSLKEQLSNCMVKQQQDMNNMAQRHNFVKMS
jgi:predicted nucleic acid binding AN1-type Zn finger protein